MKKVFYLVVLILICSCKIEPQLRLDDGIWAIKVIKINGKEFSNYLDVNTFGFKSEDNSAWFHGSQYFDRDFKAKWSIIENKNGEIDSLIIKSTIKIYNDKFKVKLSRMPHNGQPHLELKSDLVYIDAYQILR